MKHARSGVIAALGFFALVSQTLLFREYLSALEGNELGVGIFFGSWLAWVALGAISARYALARPGFLNVGFERLVPIYIPAYFLEHLLLINARSLAGAAAFETVPLIPMAAVSFLAIAPISFLTGFLFCLACRWYPGEGDRPVSRVYILETLGACLGGLAVTALLSAELPSQTIFLMAAAILLSPLLLLRFPRNWGRGAAGLALATFLVIGFLGAVFSGTWWAARENRSAWTRLLPETNYRGSFATPQGRYHHGVREDEFLVISAGSVVETLPNREHASEVAALCLAQNPGAKKVLVMGPGGLSIGLAFLRLPQMERVVWLHPDPKFPRRILEILPPRFQSAAGRLYSPELDVREMIRRKAESFDLIILNLPDAGTLALNRYATRDFFSDLNDALTEEGVLALRLAGGANFLGGELAGLGASALVSLKAVFPRVVLKPGEESWLLASRGSSLSQSPEELRDRFAAIKGADSLFPPEGLLSLYPRDRADFQMKAYARAMGEFGDELLVNTDKAPKALLFNLMLALRRAGVRSLAGHLRAGLDMGLWIILGGVLFYGLLRWIYLRRSPGSPDIPASAPEISGHETHFLIGAAGLVSMGTAIVLMFLFQSRFGTLFLHVGLISALFMAGSFVGGTLSEWLLKRGLRLKPLLAVIISCHLIFILAIAGQPAISSKILFAVFFGLCGLANGAYFPLGAGSLSRGGAAPETTGAWLEALDHGGGAIGAGLAGALFLPVLGATQTLLLLFALTFVAAVLALFAPKKAPAPPADFFERSRGAVAYALFGVGLFFLFASQLLALARAGGEEEEFAEAAVAVAGPEGPAPLESALSSGRVLRYFSLKEDAGKPGAYFFPSRTLVRGINGYGGPISMAVHIDTKGALLGFQILRSRETPAYLAFLRKWMADLAGRSLVSAEPFRGVDAISGATMTSVALMKTLEASGKAFASGILGLKVEGSDAGTRPSGPGANILTLSALLVAALLLRIRPNVALRRVMLILSVALAGFYWNLQYSTHHVLSLLSLNFPAPGFTPSFFLVVGIPAFVLLFGNVFCGYLCPFGALQELIGDLRPRGMATEPDKELWRYGRALKYLLLFWLILLFAATREYQVLLADPLITFFGSLRRAPILTLGVAVLAASFFFPRFWCRNLCPTGAFLSLLGPATILKGLLPATHPPRCDMGVRNAEELDCIRCDRCRHEKA